MWQRALGCGHRAEYPMLYSSRAARQPRAPHPVRRVESLARDARDDHVRFHSGRHGSVRQCATGVLCRRRNCGDEYTVVDCDAGTASGRVVAPAYVVDAPRHKRESGRIPGQFVRDGRNLRCRPGRNGAHGPAMGRRTGAGHGDDRSCPLSHARPMSRRHDTLSLHTASRHTASRHTASRPSRVKRVSRLVA